MIAHGCAIERCERVHYARGMCNTHYKYWRNHGTTDLPTVADRLAAGLERKPNGCLEWTRGTVKGYGRISINNKDILTHRLAWELVNGPIPDGMLIRHFICDNPPCCDPEHLRPGTIADNSADKVAKGRNHVPKAKSHCPQNHPYDSVNTYLKPNGGRDCRACRTVASARSRAAHSQVAA
jgi:hypothetical protein